MLGKLHLGQSGIELLGSFDYLGWERIPLWGGPGREREAHVVGSEP